MRSGSTTSTSSRQAALRLPGLAAGFLPLAGCFAAFAALVAFFTAFGAGAGAASGFAAFLALPGFADFADFAFSNSSAWSSVILSGSIEGGMVALTLPYFT